MKKVSLILSFVIAFILVLNAQTFEQIEYVVSNDNIANPERGFYHQVNRFSLQNLLGYKKTGIKLILKNYILKEFKNKPISADFLRDIQNDLDVIRSAGFKIIIRFAYTETLTTPYGDASPEIVLMHINQLKNLLNRNSDVILTLQAGFIGTWGEWYYTDYFSKSPGNITEENWNDRRDVVNSLLDALPKDRMIQLRTPTFIRQMQQENEFIAVVKDKAYDGSKKARLAFHNDCFVAGHDDWGTYQNLDKEKPFLEDNSKYTVVGGETCSKSSYSNCENSLKELKRFHWSFLNIDYHQGVLSQWRNEGCFEEIQNKLGFRYELIGSKLQNEGKPNGKIDLAIDLINNGWSNPTNEYLLQIVLRDTSNKNAYKYTIDEDIRKWELNKTHTINITSGLPEDMETGNYNIYLKIKDKRSTLLFDNNYNIRLANQDVWSKDYGENSLKHIITISNYNSFPHYTGNDFFVKEGTATPGFDAPEAIEITQYNNNNIVYWTRNCDYDNVITRLQRSSDNITFETIATNRVDDVSYVDHNLVDGTKYYYKLQYVSEEKYSEITSKDIIKSNSNKRQFLNVDIDGDENDWNCVVPVITGYNNEIQALKLANNRESLFYSIKGDVIADYKIYFEINDSTRYLISNDSLYKSGNDIYSFLKTVNVNNSAGFVEGTIKLSDIEFDTKPVLKVNIKVNDKEFCKSKQIYYLKFKVISIPERFKITPSVVTPYSKVKISWSLDSNVDGYAIERSVGDKNHFEVIKELGRTTSYYLDKNLDSTKVYYYRMFGFDNIIKSEYTKLIKVHLGITGIDNELTDVKCVLYPNPMSEKSTLEIGADSKKTYRIELFDANMKMVKRIYSGRISGKKIFEIYKGNLKSGLYHIVISQKYLKKTIKLIIL